MLPRVNLVRTDEHDYLLFSTKDVISKEILEKGSWGQWENLVSRVICRNLEAPLVIDLGANLGGYSIPIAKNIMPQGGRVYSFEPQRIIYYQLCGNVFLNRLDNVFAYNYAVGDEDGELEIPVIDYSKTMNIGGFSFEEYENRKHLVHVNQSKEQERVTKICLDNFAFDGVPSLLKIDVEGHELKVLKGAVGLLEESNYPPILLETWKADWFKEQSSALFSFLTKLGYEFTHVKDETLAQHPGHSLKIEVVESDGVIHVNRVR